MVSLTVFLFIALSTNYAFCARILGVFMTPSYSHQVVYQPIWKELSLRGHQVTVITPNPLHDARLINLTEIDVSSSGQIFKNKNEESLLVEISMLKEVKRLSEIYEQVARHQLSHPDVQALLKDKNQTFDLLLVEYLHQSMYALKDIYNCPMVGITSLGLTAYGSEMIGNPKNPAFDPDMASKVSVHESFQDRFFGVFYDLITRYSTKYVLLNKLDKIIAEYIDHDIRPLSEICQEFSLVITNSNLAIRKAKPAVPNLIEISGIHIQKPKALPKDLKSYLDNSTEGVIYFSLGSNMKSSLIPPKTLNNLMQVFSELPYNILWKFEKDELPNKPENVEIRKWLPQQDVLGHPNVKLFITQGGLQSIDEAIFKKVPMLLIPIFGDQYFNAHNMVRKGAALSLDYHKLTKETFKTAILELMSNPKYQNRIDDLSEIASDQIVPALDKAVWWIEYVLRHNGAEHLRYAERSVPLYQFYMFDVLAVLIVGVLAILYIISATTKIAFGLFKTSQNFFENTVKKKSE
ncbi:hypothetical protein WA026_012369 [Henosepilachna vigintioctopunctata]|uniref:UDP-glucuronosyltransferase n=1 Tax=Henosepilachna vigintioctopunctata TaxID=420089 RepID=A0AAW1UYP9_9CUCU